MTTKQKLKIAEDALRKIANPIKAMQEDAERGGARINGMLAVSVSENGAWYKEVASTALHSLENEAAETVDLPQLVRRLGRFRVSEHLVKTHPEEVMKVMMAECLVVRCELRYETMTFDYVAISPHFDVVPEWIEAPEYEEPKYEALFKGFSPAGAARADR